MVFYFPNVDPVYLYQRRGTESDPYISLMDKNNIRTNNIVLKEVPSVTAGVKVTHQGAELTETKQDDIKFNEFRVDYSVGVVFFHDSRDGEEMVVEYDGTGYVSIPSHRIVVPNSKYDAVDSLQNILNDVDDAKNVIEEVGNMKFIGNYEATKQYKKWNFINFENSTFVALKDIRGQSPHVTNNWQLVSTGIGFTGIFDVNDSYSIGTLVSDKKRKNFYISLVMGNDKPLEDETAWDLILTLDDTVENLERITNEEIAKLDVLKQALIKADKARDRNDEARDTRTDAKLLAVDVTMNEHETSEDERKSNESVRVSSEKTRIYEEENRVNNEKIRQENEENRVMEEDARKQTLSYTLEENQDLVGEVEKGLTEISNQQVIVDEMKNDADLVVANAEMLFDSIDNFTHENEYSETESYKGYNIVTHEGSTYIAVQDVPYDEYNDDPESVISLDDTDYWRLLARKGKDGTAITVEGISPDEETNDISLGVLGYAQSEEIGAMSESLEGLLFSQVGDLVNLKTAHKENLVDSINELNRKINDIIEILG